MPVSYTHLDVYKRQPIHKCSSICLWHTSQLQKLFAATTTACPVQQMRVIYEEIQDTSRVWFMRGPMTPITGSSWLLPVCTHAANPLLLTQWSTIATRSHSTRQKENKHNILWCAMKQHIIVDQELYIVKNEKINKFLALIILYQFVSINLLFSNLDILL